MTVSASDLTKWVGAPTTDSAIVEDCLATAISSVNTHIYGPLLPGPLPEHPANVPADIYDRAILEVGAELYHRKNAPNGISQFADLSGNPTRVARDAMTPAYPLLRPYLGGGFA